MRYGERGFFGVAILNPKHEVNIGTLWRTANLFNAAFLATIGGRYKKQGADTTNAERHIPLYHHANFDEFYKNLPYDCQLIGVELDKDAVDLAQFKHPHRAVYLLGAEDNGIPKSVLSKCHKVIQLRGEQSMNVAVAGSIVIYHRTSL